MAIQFLNNQYISGTLEVAGATTFDTVANPGSDTDKFVVINGSGLLGFRTGAELLADIGGSSSATTVTSVSGTQPIISSGGLTPTISLNYTGANNLVESATDLEGNSIATADSIIYNDATDGNVKKGLISDLPFSNTSGTVTSITPGADSGTGTAITTSGTITVAGGSNITTSVSGTTITVNTDFNQYGWSITDGSTTNSIPSGTTVTWQGGTGINTSLNGYILDIEIDSSVIPSGSGTSGKLAKWTGANTLGDGPVTISGNDATFAGKILASNDAPAFAFASDTETGMARTGTHQIAFKNNDVDSLTLAADLSATFAGDILTNTDSSSDIGKTATRWANIWVDNINGGTPTTGGPYLPLAGGTLTGNSALSTAGTATFTIESSGVNGNNVYLALASSDTEWRWTTNRGDQISGNQGDLFLREDTAGVNALIFETNTGNATFAGTVAINYASGDNVTSGLYVYNSNGAAQIRMEGGSDEWLFNTNYAATQLDIKSKVGSGSTNTVLSLTPTVATFQGDVEIRTGKKLILQRPNNGVATEISTDSTGAMVLNSINSEGFFFNNNGTNIFKLDPVNATFAGTVSGTTATFTTFSGDLNGTINTATTAVTKGNAVNDTTVATTAFVQNVVGTIPAGLVFQGTWNASTNTPTLASGSGTTGHFYIVSVAGSTNLDGVTDWEVGDWAVFIEQGASDQWEKIDNSSVLGGSGSGGSLTAWAGSGTSVTLTNAPVTYSGNNTTFAGNVELKSDAGNATKHLRIWNEGTAANDDAVLSWTAQASRTYSMGIHRDSGNLVISNADASVASGDLINVNTSGNVGIGTASPTSPTSVTTFLEIEGTTAGIVLHDDGNDAWDLFASGGKLGTRYNNSVEGWWLLEDGKIGIGQTAPSSKLSNSAILNAAASGLGTSLLGLNWEVPAGASSQGYVASFANTQTASANANAGVLIEVGSTDTTTRLLSVESGGVNRFEVRGDGNVGIGTDSPDEKLHINKAVSAGSDNLLLRIQNPTTAADARVGIAFSVNDHTGTNWDGAYIQAENDGIAQADLTFGSAVNNSLSQHMIIEGNTGNVGIGTTSPQVRLQLERTVSAGTSRTAPVNLMYLTSEHPSVGYTGFGTAITHYSRTYQNSTKTEQSKIAFTQQGDSTSTAGSTIDFYTKTLSTGSAAPEFRMRINYDGNVGIGTSAPQELLHLYKTGDIKQEIESLNENAYLIINSGADGVGDSNREEGFIKFYQANNDFWSLGKRNNGYFSLYDHTAAKYVMQFGDNGAFELTPANNITTITGNVGIGTTAPQSYDNEADDFVVFNSTTPGITIATDTSTDPNYNRGSLLFADGTGASAYRGGVIYDHGTGMGGIADTMYLRAAVNSYLVLDPTGKVGIGTKTPSNKLHIAETTNVDAILSLNANSSALGTSYMWNLVGASSSSNYSFQIREASSPYLSIRNSAGGSAGALQLNAYGAGTFTGTATYKLSVDASGNVIETAIGAGAVDGSGTAGTITKWTDSDTIGDSPITISGSDATFAGDVNVQNNASRIISLNYEDSINSIISHSGTNFGLESLNVRGDNIYFYTDYDAGTPKGNLTLTLDNSHNATFVGNVAVGGGSVIDILGYGNTAHVLSVQGIRGSSSVQRPVVFNLAGQRDDGTDGYVSDINFLSMASNGTTVNSRAIIRMSRENADNSNQLEFWTSAAGSTTKALTLDRSQNATFAGNVGIGITPTTTFEVRCASDEHFTVSDALSTVALKAHNNGASAYIPMSINASTLALNTDSGGSISFGGDILSTPIFTAGIRVRGGASTPIAGEARIGGHASHGAQLYGSGASTDLIFLNKNGSTVMSVATGTINTTFAGNITGVGATFLGAAASGAALVTIENNSGSTATSYGLLVKGGGNSSSGKTFEVRDDSGNTDLMVTGAGNVGIGTATPQNILHLKSDDPKLILEDGNAGTDEKVYAIYPAGSQYVLQTMTDAHVSAQNAYVVDRTGTAVDTHKWYTANSERMRIQSNGNVLIGTTGATNTRLKVVQNVASEWACQITNTAASAYGLAIDTSANTGVYSLGVYTNTGTGMFVRNNGRVGIGTTDPSYPLVVSNGGAGGIEFVPGAIAGMQEILSYNRSGAAYEKLRFSTLSYEFYTSTISNALVILNGGNVGIKNIANPDAILQIANNDSSSYRFGYGGTSDVYLDADNIYFRSDNGGTNYFTFTSGNLGIGTTTPTNGKLVINNLSSATSFGGNVCQLFENFSTTDGQMMSIGFRNNNSVGTTALIDAVAYDQSLGATDLRFSLYSGSAWNSNMVTFQHTGRVGIGTSSPTYRLQVHNDNEDILKLYNTTDGLDALISFSNPGGTLARIQGIDNGGLAFDTGNNAGGINSNAMFIDNAGHVGIGNTNPSRPLDITSDSGAVALKLRARSANDYAFLSFTQNDGSGTIWAELAGMPTGLRFDTNGSERMRINSTGNVGIGTTADNDINEAKLYVNGTLGLDANSEIKYGKNAGGPYLNIRSKDSSTSACGIRIHSPSGSPGYLYGEGSSGSNAYIGILDGDGAWGYQIRTDTSHTWMINNSNQMHLTTTGLGIGNTVPANKLHVTTSTGQSARFEATGQYTSLIEFKSLGTAALPSVGAAGDDYVVWTNGAERMRISSAGKTAINHATSNRTLVIGGALDVQGTLYKTSGSFAIDHPLESKKDTHKLIHSFIEGPKADNIYRGKAQLKDGSVVVNLDTVSEMTEGTFVLLNRDVQCFTSNESDWDSVKGTIEGNLLTISCKNASSNAMISWMVVGERQDKEIKESELTDDNGKVIVEPTIEEFEK